jgi:hypothetical protein
VASDPTFGNREQFSDFSNAKQGAIWRLLHFRRTLRSTTIRNARAERVVNRFQVNHRSISAGINLNLRAAAPPITKSKLAPFNRIEFPEQFTSANRSQPENNRLYLRKSLAAWFQLERRKLANSFFVDSDNFDYPFSNAQLKPVLFNRIEFPGAIYVCQPLGEPPIGTAKARR